MHLRVSLALALLLTVPSLAHAEREYSGGVGSGVPRPIALEAGPLSIHLHGRAQVNFAFLAGDDARLDAGDAAENAGVRLRRARLGLEGRIDRARVGVEVDLLESQGTALHEAYVGYDSRWALAYAGLVKVPLSRSALISSEALQLADRGFGIRGIAPFQQLGLTVGGKFWEDRIRLLAGVFNGMQRTSTFNGGWDRINPAKGNRFGGVATAVRLDVEPLGVLGAGAGDLGAERKFRFGIGGGFLYNAGQTITSVGFAGDVALKAWGFSLMGEFLQVSSKPAETPTSEATLVAETTMRTAVAQAGYAIPMPSWDSALEVAVRWELTDENTEVKDSGDFMAIGAAVSAYLIENYVKVQLQYTHRTETEGANLENDVFMLSAEGRF